MSNPQILRVFCCHFHLQGLSQTPHIHSAAKRKHLPRNLASLWSLLKQAAVASAWWQWDLRISTAKNLCHTAPPNFASKVRTPWNLQWNFIALGHPTSTKQLHTCPLCQNSATLLPEAARIRMLLFALLPQPSQFQRNSSSNQSGEISLAASPIPKPRPNLAEIVAFD